MTKLATTQIWGLWENWNKMAVEKKLHNNPSQILFLGLSSVQKW
jgi:hypothetical protein